MDLKPSEINDFERDGVILLKQAVPQSWVKKLQDELEQQLNGTSKHPINFRDHKNAPDHKTATSVWKDNKLFKQYLFESDISEIGAKLLKSKTIRLFGDQLHIKLPGCKDRTYWHQDKPVFAIEGEQCCSAWLALDEIHKTNGALEFIRGSHKGPLYKPRTSLRGEVYNKIPYDFVPDIEANRDDYDIVSFDMQPGDLLVFHIGMLHGACANTTLETMRRGFVARLIGDDIRYNLRDWQEDIVEHYPLENGDEFDCDVTPELYKCSN